jgi:hypothetical protein
LKTFITLILCFTFLILLVIKLFWIFLCSTQVSKGWEYNSSNMSVMLFVSACLWINAYFIYKRRESILAAKLLSILILLFTVWPDINFYVNLNRAQRPIDEVQHRLDTELKISGYNEKYIYAADDKTPIGFEVDFNLHMPYGMLVPNPRIIQYDSHSTLVSLLTTEGDYYLTGNNGIPYIRLEADNLNSRSALWPAGDKAIQFRFYSGMLKHLEANNYNIDKFCMKDIFLGTPTNNIEAYWLDHLLNPYIKKSNLVTDWNLIQRNGVIDGLTKHGFVACDNDCYCKQNQINKSALPTKP